MTRKDELNHYLQELQLTWPRQHYEALSEQALKEHWTPTDYLAHLLEGECHRRRENRIRRRIQAARFPVLKTLETFNWSWPKKIDRVHIQDLFRLAFLEKQSNVIFLGGRGTGQDASGHRPGPSGLSGRPQRPMGLHGGHDQHADRRAGRTAP